MKTVSVLLQSLGASIARASLVLQPTDGSRIQSKASCDFHHYGALGDSYAAGINSNPDGELLICDGTNGGDSGPYCTTKICAKNNGSYAWQLHNTYQTTDDFFDFFACSGIDTLDCLTLQVPKINSSTDLITINIGSNNGGMFSRIVTKCVYTVGQVGCTDALASAQSTITSIQPDLKSVIGELKIRASSAKVIVLSYVPFWPTKTNSTLCQSRSLKRPTNDQRTLMNTLVLRLNAALSEVAASVEVDFVDVNSYFEGHRLCEADPYFQWSLFDEGDDDGVDDPNLDLFNKGVFHPTAEGQQMYLKAISDYIGC